MKRIILSTLLVTILTSTTACFGGRAAGEGDTLRSITPEMYQNFMDYGSDIELVFHHGLGQDKQQTIDRYIAAFQEEYEHVKISQVYTGGYANLHSAIEKTLLSGTNIPDIVMSYPDHLADYMVNNYVYRLDGFFNSSVVVNGKEKVGLSGIDGENNYAESDIVPNFLEEVKDFLREGTYGIPFNKSSEVLVYNKTALEAAGFNIPTGEWTWENVEDAAAAFKTYATSLHPAETLIMPFSWDSTSNLFITLVKQWGGADAYTVKEVSGKDAMHKHVKFHESEEAVDALYYYLNNAQKGLFNVPGYFASAKSYSDDVFKAQQVGLVLSSSAGVKGIYPDGNAFEVGVTGVPQRSGATAAEKVVTQQGTNVSMLYKKTKNAALDEAKMVASYLFIRSLTNTTNTVDWALDTGYVPVRTSALDNSLYQAAAQSSIFAKTIVANRVTFDQMEYMQYTPAFAGSSKIRDIVDGLMTDLISMTLSWNDQTTEAQKRTEISNKLKGAYTVIEELV